MASAVMVYESLDPMQIGLLCPVTVVLDAKRAAYLIQKWRAPRFLGSVDSSTEHEEKLN
jgi:hypothetical protein